MSSAMRETEFINTVEFEEEPINGAPSNESVEPSVESPPETLMEMPALPPVIEPSKRGRPTGKPAASDPLVKKDEKKEQPEKTSVAEKKSPPVKKGPQEKIQIELDQKVAQFIRVLEEEESGSIEQFAHDAVMREYAILHEDFTTLRKQLKSLKEKRRG